MKFIPIEKARGLKFQQTVFIKDETGFRMGKLIKKQDVGNGIEHTFEVADYADEYTTEPQPRFSVTVTHVAIPAIP